MKRFAVIDLGTNTFHLLITGRKSETEFIEIYRERIQVRLGQESMSHLNKAAFKRALSAIEKISQIVNLFEAIEVKAFATAAFRSAQNAAILIRRIQRNYGIHVEIISGEKEAQTIYEGVRYAGALGNKDQLIMDIGGGSVELIIGNAEDLSWSVSLPIGASILKNRFHLSEPMSMDEQNKLKSFLQHVLVPLETQLTNYASFSRLIGSSGTFDVLAEAIPVIQYIEKCPELDISDFQRFKNEIIQLDLDQRIAHALIPENRADLIVVALILIDEIIKMLPDCASILASPYALKEGMISQMIAEYVV